MCEISLNCTPPRSDPQTPLHHPSPRTEESPNIFPSNPKDSSFEAFLEITYKAKDHLRGRLRGRTATQRSKKGSEKVLGRVLGKGSGEGVLRRVLRRGPAMGFTVKKGSEKAVSRKCLERPLGEYAPLGVRPTR